MATKNPLNNPFSTRAMNHYDVLDVFASIHYTTMATATTTRTSTTTTTAAIATATTATTTMATVTTRAYLVRCVLISLH